MLKQGKQVYRLDEETQEILCHNPEDHEHLIVYFACCNTNTCECVDPVIDSSGPSARNDDDNAAVDLALATTTGSSIAASSTNLAVLVASSTVCSAVVASVITYKLTAERFNKRQSAQQVQEEEEQEQELEVE